MTETQPQTQLATRAFQPLAPIGSASGLKGLLNTQAEAIAATLPRHVSPARLIKTMLVAANRNPDLLKCTQASIIETINRAAELGLDLSGTLGEAYPVPFNNKIRTDDGEKWVMQCQLLIGYRGFVKLARQTGEIQSIDADVVCLNDKFIFRKGKNATFEFEPNLTGERGEPVGAYAYVVFKDGGEQFDFMPVADIDKVRMRSKSGSDREGNPKGPWKTDWSEMAKKTVFRRLAKWLPLSTEKYEQAMEHDNATAGMTDIIEAELKNRAALGNGKGGTNALVDKLHARALGNVARHPDGTPIELPDTQLSEEEAERVLIEKSNRNASSPAPAAGIPPAEDPAPPLSEDQPGTGDDVQDEQEPNEQADDRITIKTPAGMEIKTARTLPAAARVDAKWVDDLIVMLKPATITAGAARTMFHKQHSPVSWNKLKPETQDDLYASLVCGHVVWSA